MASSFKEWAGVIKETETGAEEIMKKQQDWWNLDMAFGKFMYPRIMQLIKKGNGYHGRSLKAWDAKLHLMAGAFKWLSNPNRSSFDDVPKEVEAGMRCFAKNVYHLWD